MPTYIKTGYWSKLKKGFEGYLNLDDLIRNISPPVAPKYLEYSLFASQTSTNAPTIISNLNTLGVVALTRVSAGTYTFLSNSLFTENKTVPNKINTVYDAAGNKITIEWTSATTITLKTYNSSDVLTDGILDEQEINIKVFI